jgi:hypothetical protein
VSCALVPDLYCPAYSSAEALSKEANLMRTAGRYKIDASKVTTIITRDFSRRRKSSVKKGNDQEAKSDVQNEQFGRETERGL